MAGPKSGKGRRAKGQAGEREFFYVLNNHLPARLRTQRNLGQERDSGLDGSVGSVMIEVKRQENLRLGPWLKQLRDGLGSAQQGVDVTGVLAYRQNNDNWHCLVDLSPAELADYIIWRENSGSNGEAPDSFT